MAVRKTRCLECGIASPQNRNERPGAAQSRACYRKECRVVRQEGIWRSRHRLIAVVVGKCGLNVESEAAQDKIGGCGMRWMARPCEREARERGDQLAPNKPSPRAHSL
jgi:hypothetical protein